MLATDDGLQQGAGPWALVRRATDYRLRATVGRSEAHFFFLPPPAPSYALVTKGYRRRATGYSKGPGLWALGAGRWALGAGRWQEKATDDRLQATVVRAEARFLFLATSYRLACSA